MPTWKANWDESQKHFKDWWNRKGLVLSVTAEAKTPAEALDKPVAPPGATQEFLWSDPNYRASLAEWRMAGTYYGTDVVPYLDTQIGPGSLGTFLGSKPNFVRETVWYEPCISNPDHYDPIRFDPENHWFRVHMALIEEGLRRTRGRYLVGIPDLIENIDTLAALRGTENLLMDMLERPAWVEQKVREINRAYFAAFDLMFQKVKDEHGGNAFAAFGVWGPGKTAKLQCDFSAMISPEMFRRFVQPGLREQCRWLDYSVYHLDGATALQHLEPLLEIAELDAIEWTPQAGIAGGGDERWHDLYKRIKKGGKSVEAIGATAREIEPLLDAVGPEGMMILTDVKDQDEAERLYRLHEKFGC